MIMNSNFVFGDNKRIFLNTILGCASSCSYCYLSTLNLKLNSKVQISKLISILENNRSDFIQGKNGTILSVGCYCECWDDDNRSTTIELINHLLKYENPIQIATKQQITLSDFEQINIDKITYYNHLSVFISSSTITHHSVLEKGTTKPSLRFNSFKIKNKYNIPMYLYLKPIIDKITIQDINKYINLIKKYNIEVIVGELFNKNGSLDAPIANGILKYDDNQSDDMQKMCHILKKYTNVYKKSIEPILEGLKNVK